ncbi:MAG: family 78 glycoside hydrolase catalytic domain [Bacilli bacterium]
MNEIRLLDLRCEYRDNPLGIDVPVPRFAWRIESDRRGTLQRAYRIQVSISDAGFSEPLWDSGIVDSEDSLHVPYGGQPLQSFTRYYYRVKLWCNLDRESDWSSISWWETAFLGMDAWRALWITPDSRELDRLAEPAFLLRKQFAAHEHVVWARVYVTGVGLYELYLNGKRVGEDLLTPGWTSYHTRLQYQTYDVTQQLHVGDNAMGIVLADGWYKGELAWASTRHHYGDRRAARAELHVRYSDGTQDIVVTDESWKAATGPIRYAELYHGEVYDAQLEQTGWTDACFGDDEWPAVTTLDVPVSCLVAQENWPTRVTEVLHPTACIVTPNGDTVLDMGQNMVGRIRMHVSAAADTRIVLEHAEVLDGNGNFYVGNLRKAKQRVEYIAKGEGDETYAPHFTFQGFRYVRVTGYPRQELGLPLDRFVGEVIHSDMPSTGEFSCSNEQVNQLQRNIVWGQRGNFVDVPTDCPQRDERLGWTGDAQVFIRTALFNYQGSLFFGKWLRDLATDQREDGGVPSVIPDVLRDPLSSSAWGDAATVCPWAVYRQYADTRLLAEQYESMKAWVSYIRGKGENEFLWNSGFHFGDWLALDAQEDSYIGATPTDLIATAFYAHSTRIVRDAARVLGYDADAADYDALLHQIVQAFRNEFVTPNGRIVSSTQTAHVLPLMFDLLEGKDAVRAARMLNQMIVDNKYHLTTGFVGTPYLCHVLSQAGYHDTALALLLQDSYPGWLYSVGKGATTIWEHWDGIKPDGSFWSDDMNSFNHYAYGAIGDWLYRVVAGLDMDETQPAFKRVRIAPHLGRGQLTHAAASYNSMYGPVRSAWATADDHVEISVQIPPNCTADVYLPGAGMDGLSCDGAPITMGQGVHACTIVDGGARVEIGSGEYQFAYCRNISRRLFTDDSTIADVLQNPMAKDVLESYVPGIATKYPTMGFLRSVRLKELDVIPPHELAPGRREALGRELLAMEE